MEDGSDSPREWHSYRCPVCGHRDEVHTEPGMVRSISCSHCDTGLKVEAGSSEDAGVTVKVDTAGR